MGQPGDDHRFVAVSFKFLTARAVEAGKWAQLHPGICAKLGQLPAVLEDEAADWENLTFLRGANC